MELELFARTVLFGTTLEEKLFSPSEPMFSDNSSTPLKEVPLFPNRPAYLKIIGKSEFPKTLISDTDRAHVLHFFANHELLALELMALMLLRFPEAPKPFREGIARTMLEEQSHMRLYIERMRELSVDFGDLPLSNYFWNLMKDMRSPMDFVTQMSLTFEQANLDFSLFYHQEISKVGDDKTAAILERVYREEIGHVKHGLSWFNRWREPKEESDWSSYLRLLPPPLTARRAKGQSFSPEARRLAGFSETFIEELEIYSGSRGRLPNVWLYNPLCDFEVARGKPGFTPKASAAKVISDLEHVPMYLAQEDDVILVHQRPSVAWLKEMHRAGFKTPVLSENLTFPQGRLSGFEPWGWSPESFEVFKPKADLLVVSDGGNASWCSKFLKHNTYSETGLSPLFSKAWSTQFFRDWMTKHPEAESAFGTLDDLGTSYSDFDLALVAAKESVTRGQHLMLKAPWGTSGNQVRKITSLSELNQTPTRGWIENTINTQGSIVIEPWLNKYADLSIQIFVDENSTEVLGARRFLVGPRFEYRGTILGRKLSTLSASAQRFLSEKNALTLWQQLARDLAQELRASGYSGPAGLDGLLWKTSDGRFRLKPLVELNPRWTMGRVALEIEKQLTGDPLAAWLFIPTREIHQKGWNSLAEFIQHWQKKFPLEFSEATGSKKIVTGIVPTSDPHTVQEVLTLLVVGEQSTAAIFDFFKDTLNPLTLET